MSKALSALILASAFAILVPDNRAQAVAAAEFAMPVAAGQGVLSVPAVSAARESPEQVPPEMSWLLALGFLGVVVARRLRAD